MLRRQHTTCLAWMTLFILGVAPANAGHTNNILVTGYWPNTNEMVRHFSTNPSQNPMGWQGENWEGSGYNIHSYFPEFPGGVGNNPKGNGDFEVDYQDTSDDWWRITSEINPVAIITFSRGANNFSWEFERINKNWSNWIPDYEAPMLPTPSPPDSSIPPNAIRESTLPMEQMVDDVRAEIGFGLSVFIDETNGGGRFLSEYIGYHGVWYQDMHKDPSDPFQSVAAGHIHVGQLVGVDLGRRATEASLRSLISYVNTVVPEPHCGWMTWLVVIAAGASRRR